MKFKSIIFFFLVFFSGYASADPWSGATKITWLYPQTGGLAFKTTNYSSNLVSCDGGSRFILLKSHDNYDVLASALMAAFMTDKTVNVNINAEGVSTPQCQLSINRLFVNN